ncbi:MAG: hypothetical protein U0792_08580 [Gemmataceae bacterium]
MATGRGGLRRRHRHDQYELVRLQHSDKSWNKNFGIGSDRNLLAELKARERSEDQRGRSLHRLQHAGSCFREETVPAGQSGVGGTSTFAPRSTSGKILREYLIDKHGMILGDNLGGRNFHHNFVNEMTRITGIQPVEIPRTNDRINQRPYDLPLLPILVSHTKPVAETEDRRSLGGPITIRGPSAICGVTTTPGTEGHLGIRLPTRD